jgi:hypothetical protein
MVTVPNFSKFIIGRNVFVSIVVISELQPDSMSFSEGALRNRIFIFIVAHAALLGGALTLLHP